MSVYKQNLHVMIINDVLNNIHTVGFKVFEATIISSEDGLERNDWRHNICVVNYIVECALVQKCV